MSMVAQSTYVSRRNGAEGSTPHQRLYTRVLFDRLELSTDRFTFQHRGPFKQAGLPEPEFDADVDAHLRSLTRRQASDLIRVLEQRADVNQEEDD